MHVWRLLQTTVSVVFNFTFVPVKPPRIESSVGSKNKEKIFIDKTDFYL